MRCCCGGGGVNGRDVARGGERLKSGENEVGHSDSGGWRVKGEGRFARKTSAG